MINLNNALADYEMTELQKLHRSKGFNRTSYFKVQDEDTFLMWVSRLQGVDVDAYSGHSGKLFCLLFENGIWGLDGHEGDILDELAEHLMEGWNTELLLMGNDETKYSTIVCSNGGTFTCRVG